MHSVSPKFFLLIFSCISAVSLAGKERPTLTVFVHGTLRWYLAFTSPSWFLTGHVEDTALYSTWLKNSRDDTRYFERHVMLDVGLVEVPRMALEAARSGDLPPDDARFASYYVLSAYDAVAQKIGVSHPDDSYALFGWSGLNSQRARKQGGYELYESLCKWRDEYKNKHNVTPRFRIIAYSHGGGAALWMVDAEQKLQKELKIDVLALFGTPMQVEISRFLTSDMFRSIIALRSAGDRVQTVDSFSTVVGESFAEMREMVNIDRLNRIKPHLHRADVMLSINHDTYKIDHYNLFDLDKNPLHFALDPFPVIVLAPAIMHQVLAHSTHNALRARITCDNDLVTVRLKSGYFYYPAPLGESDNLYDTLDEQRSIVQITGHQWVKRQKSL